MLLLSFDRDNAYSNAETLISSCSHMQGMALIYSPFCPSALHHMLTDPASDEPSVLGVCGDNLIIMPVAVLCSIANSKECGVLA